MRRLPACSIPLRNVDFELRFVSRFLPLSQAEAEVQLRKLEKQILTTEVSFGGMLAHVFGGGPSRVRSNSGAELFAKDTDAARQENFTDVVRFGRWTACVVVWAHDLRRAEPPHASRGANHPWDRPGLPLGDAERHRRLVWDHAGALGSQRHSTDHPHAEQGPA